ncbi:hypothetical protein B0H14DRAFT_3656033 [Mycena olivaceomarginata]|nr:hypothetical protein B0H14DRAFT_3656033 [Mycena olivaceomarginata]
MSRSISRTTTIVTVLTNLALPFGPTLELVRHFLALACQLDFTFTAIWISSEDNALAGAASRFQFARLFQTCTHTYHQKQPPKHCGLFPIISPPSACAPTASLFHNKTIFNPPLGSIPLPHLPDLRSSDAPSSWPVSVPSSGIGPGPGKPRAPTLDDRVRASFLLPASIPRPRQNLRVLQSPLRLGSPANSPRKNFAPGTPTPGPRTKPRLRRHTKNKTTKEEGETITPRPRRAPARRRGSQRLVILEASS